MNRFIYYLLFFLFFIEINYSNAQITQIGSGSYINTLPPADAAGRNQKPSGTPKVSGAASLKPIPTNDWWTGLLSFNDANLYNYPLSMKATNNGMLLSYTFLGNGAIDSRQPMGPEIPILIGLHGISGTYPTVSDHSDWLVQTSWNQSGKELKANFGMGMPFVYFTKSTNDSVKITVNTGTVSIQNEILLITNSISNASFVIYAPVGSIWNKSGSVYTSTLNNKNYFSAALLPLGSNATTISNEYKQYAYVFPVKSEVTYLYDSVSSMVKSDFMITTEIKEGLSANVLQGLLPHQWAHLSQQSAKPGSISYQTSRGAMKMLASNTFTVENKFNGVLSTLPNLARYSDGFNPGDLDSKIEMLKNAGLDTWTDSYNEGLAMNKLIQVARIAHQTGNLDARDKIINTVKTRLEDWLKAESAENAFIFYYDKTWTTLIGYPAGYSADANINDHHFHYGYFIMCAAAIEQFQPGWATQWGPMVNLLIKDAANQDRNDVQFPFLRNFNPYAGHSFASGLLNNEPHGNNQESSSEAMNFNASLIHWGELTGNKSIRDLGIYLYTTEQSAIDEYYFNKSNRNFSSNYSQIMCSRVWSNGYDRGTFWTNDIAAMYGIEIFPLTGSSLYLANDTAYVRKLWNDMKSKTGVVSNTPNDNLWFEIYWSYLAMIDAPAAIQYYNNYKTYKPKGGCSDAQTYHWLHTYNSIGYHDISISSNYPIAAVFRKFGVKTYVAHNYGKSAITVKYSDGFTMDVPAGIYKTSRDNNLSGVLSSDKVEIKKNESINLIASATGGNISKVEFYKGLQLIQSVSSSPYQVSSGNLSAGIHQFYAKIYSGNTFQLSNIISVTVGSQIAYGGIPVKIPTAKIEAGNYDNFEGGLGQNVSYFDNTSINSLGTFRAPEYVDAGTNASEGNVVEYVEPGEWLEYTVDIEKAGTYDLIFRYSSGNASGGGPFHIEVDGQTVASQIMVSSTSNNWKTYSNKIVNNIVLPAGIHVIRLAFDQAGYNLGRFTFTFKTGVGVDEHKINSNINFYPNPSSDYIYFTDESIGGELRIYDISGKFIRKEIITKSEFDIQELMQGIYMMQVEKINIIKTIRFIKL
jgi:endoglucanase Acf2